MSDRRPLAILLVLVTLLQLYRVWVIHHLGLDLFVDEAYYWGWSQHLDWGYYSKPPVIAGLIALCTHVFGTTALAIKLPSLVLYPLAAIALYLLGERLYSPKIGFWAALAFICLPLVSALGLFVSTDAPLLFCWTAGMLLVWSAIQRHRLGDWIWVGVLCGLGLMSKYTMLAFVGSTFLVLLAMPHGRRELASPRPWIALILALAILAPNLWWNWLHNFPTFHHTAEITRLDHRAWNPAAFGEFLAAQALSFGPVLVIAFLATLWGMLRGWRDDPAAFLALYALPLLLLVAVQALTGRANGNWAAPIYPPALLMLVAFLAHRRAWRWVAIGVLVNLICSVVLYQWPDVVRFASGHPALARSDPYKRARGWSELVSGAKPYLQAFPNALLVSDNRELLAQFEFEARPRRVASWNPYGRVESHYDLVSHLTPADAQDVIFIAQSKDIPNVISRFAASEYLGEVDVDVHPHLKRRIWLYHLSGFKGYQ